MDPFFLLFEIYMCLPYCLVCSLKLFRHLLGKGWPLGSLLCYVSCVFVTFPYGVLGQDEE